MIVNSVRNEELDLISDSICEKFLEYGELTNWTNGNSTRSNLSKVYGMV